MADPAESARLSISWWARLRDDLGRRIEHRGFVIWYLIIERGLRGIAVLVLGLYLLTVRRDQIVTAVASIQARYGLAEGSGSLIQRSAEYFLVRVAHLSARGVVLIAVGSILYGALELFEATGLIMRRRWAEYVVVIATGFGIPVEVREVIVHASFLRAAFLAINIAIVVYLVLQKRLFIFDEGANT